MLIVVGPIPYPPFSEIIYIFKCLHVFHNVLKCYTHKVAKYFNGHLGEGNRGDENVIGRYGDKARNAEGRWWWIWRLEWKWLW